LLPLAVASAASEESISILGRRSIQPRGAAFDHFAYTCVHAMNASVPTSHPDPDADGSSQHDALRLAILRALERDPSMSQRELSRSVGMSVGKTHYLLHALLDKGWVKTRNFRRSDNKLAYAYLLTPTGLRHKLALTRRFLVRKEQEFETLRETIDQLRAELHPLAKGTPTSRDLRR
jgi:EPS-associated MarR family transcriptional regulator